MGYEIVEHTADVGLRVWGPTIEALFSDAAAGMAGLITDAERLAPTETRTVEAEGDDLETLLVAWLNELLYLVESERFVFRQARAERVGDGRVRGTVTGRTAPEGFAFAREIKAATYHNLAVERTDRGFEATVVFDL